jgi:hypothetical protein
MANVRDYLPGSLLAKTARGVDPQLPLSFGDCDRNRPVILKIQGAA